MDFVSERTIGGQSVVMLAELLDYVDEKKINLMLRSGSVQVFERSPAGIVKPGSIEEMELAIEHCGEDLSDAAWHNLSKWPERLKAISDWWPELGYDFFILSDVAQKIVSKTSQNISPQGFILSIKTYLDGILSVTRDFSGAEALKRATNYLEHNPCEKINVNWLSKEDFPECSDPLVTHRGRIANMILNNNGFSQLPQQEIKKILAAKK